MSDLTQFDQKCLPTIQPRDDYQELLQLWTVILAMFDLKENIFDRVAVIMTGHEIEKLLGVPQLSAGTGDCSDHVQS